MSFISEDWHKKEFPAGTWALEERARPRMVAGNDSEIIWADGEAFYIVGDTGHGKSTLAQNLIKVSIGLTESTMGWQVRPFERILYVAADRPSQIRSSMARLIPPAEKAVWDKKVMIWEGQLPFDIEKEVDSLAFFATEKRWGDKGAECLVLDSLKDLTSNLTDDDVGARVAYAFRAVLEREIQLLVLHHPRKRSQENKKRIDPTMDDVYGSFKFTGSAGTVLYLQPTDESDIKKVFQLKAAEDTMAPRNMRLLRKEGTLRWEI